MSYSEMFVAFVTLVRKEIRRFMRIWVQTLVPPAITMTLYFVIFGKLIGSRIGDMGGISYMQFVVPGLIMMSVINNSYSNVVSSFFGAKFNKSVEELLVSPTPSFVILSGYVFGGMARGLFVGAIVTVMSTFFTSLHIEHLGITILTVLLTSIMFSLAGFINAVFANSFDDINIIPTFVLTPLIYLGGVFYSVSLLPDFWAGVSKINPMLYMVNTFRYGIIGVSDIDHRVAFGMIVAFIVVIGSVAYYLLETGRRIRT
jgi:ABC-2 type transport system permease protein